MSEHTEAWDKVRNLLREAQDCLKLRTADPGSISVPDSLLRTIQEAAEFLDRNELELAWDALASIATQVNAPATCWQQLAQAARLMELTDKAEEASRRAEGLPSEEDYEWPAPDLTEDEWRQFVAHGLRNELQDPREDIYKPEDGDPVDEQG